MEHIDSENDLHTEESVPLFSFVDEEAQTAFGQQLNILRRNREFCDVVLQVGQQEIAGHKCVLALASPRLFNIFNKDVQSSYEIDHLGIEYESVDALIEYAYTSRLTARAENVKTLFRAAAKYQMDRLVQACGSFLITHVTVQNCIGVRSIINREYTAELADRIDNYIQTHFAEVLLTPDFIVLPRIQLEVIQKSDQEVMQTNEQHLCQMAVDFLKKCVVDETWTLDMMTEKVHLLFLKDEDNMLHDCLELDESQDTGLNQETCVQDYKVLSKNKSAIPLHKPGKSYSRNSSLNRNPTRARQLLFSGNVDGQLPQSDLDYDIKWRIICVLQTAERTHVALAVADRKLVVLSVVQRVAATNGAAGDSQHSLSHDEGDSTETRKSTLSPMIDLRAGFGAACFNNKIVVAGGYNRGECLKAAEMFDSIANKWTPLEPMSTPRARFDIAVLNDSVYAVCGSDGTKDLQTAECFGLEKSVWEPIASLSSPRSSAGVCALEERVICIGGWSGQTVMKNVDAYDPSTDQWLAYNGLQTSRSQAGVDVLDGRIYVVGGTDQWDRLSTVEAYDPRTDSWSFVAPLQTARRGAAVARYNGKLYVIGGSDGSQSLTSVEIYEPRTNKWIPGPSLGVNRANPEAVQLENKHLFALGGYSGKVFLSSMEVLHENEWTEFLECDKLRRL